MTIEDKIAKEMERLISELIDSHNRLGMKATGDWIESLAYEVDGTTSKITGNKYTEQLVQGREPGRRPPIDPLQRWAQAKFGVGEKEARGIAFAVSKKIADEGTTWYQKGGSDLLEAVLTQENLDRVRDGVAEVVTLTTAQALIRQLQTA